MNKDREKLILEKLIKNKRVSVKELSKEIYASEQSIRRDLQSLAKQGLLKKVHGGAILEESHASAMKIPFMIRELEQSNEKLMIARKAAELVKDNNVIMLDGSSSASKIIPFLSGKSNLTIITNGLRSVETAGEYNIKVYSTGGSLIPSCLTLVGEEAYRTIESFNADICFFSCRGLSEKGTATDFSIEENLVRQKMMNRSAVKVLLCNSHKIGKKYMHNLCKKEHLDYIISDISLPDFFYKKK